MASIRDFEPFVALDVSGCPLPVVRQALQLALVDFCRRSRVWRATCDAGAVQDGTSLYTIVAPTGAAVSALDSVLVDGRAIPKGTYSLEGGAVQLPGRQRAGAEVEAVAILEPLITATTVPDLLLEYTEGIASGAKYRLMLQPGKAWSSPDLAIYHRRAFDDAVGAAFARSETGGVISTITAKPKGAFGRHY